MPPPNITGKLHLGHALFSTIQDALIRFHRMEGYNTLWQPGTDHAGIATHEKILAEAKSKGLDNPSREQYDQIATNWRDNMGETISHQIRKMGASCDWDREIFTLDESHSNATYEALIRCNEKGILYREDNQWWLDMSSLAEQLLEKYHNGELKIIPKSGGKTFCHFLENIQPWCISRQIWWGHRIPIWWNDDGDWTTAHSHEEAIAKIGECHQDEDILDTWFSSSLWPFSILGWPNDTDDFKTFYPATLIETAEDILFFWCARMLMMGLLLTDQLPFDTIYLHGIIRDANGDKMSKSLGNGIDPLDIISEYGCDALRFGLLENNTAGQDMNIDPELTFGSAKRFMNKIWQASRFILMHYDRIKPEIKSNDHPLIDELNECKKNYKSHMKAYRFNMAAGELRQFFKYRLCDHWIETSKDALYKQNDEYTCQALIYSLTEFLAMLHPISPFISERIYGSYNSDLLITRLT